MSVEAHNKAGILITIGRPVVKLSVGGPHCVGVEVLSPEKEALKAGGPFPVAGFGLGKSPIVHLMSE